MLPGFYAAWCQLRFSRCSAAVCSCCLSSASAVLRRRVCPRSMRCQASKCWCQLRSRVAVLPCAVAVYPRRRLCSPSPCALARCAARLLCWRQLTVLRDAPGVLARWPRPPRLGNNFNLRRDGELPLRVCEITPAFKCEGLRAVGPSLISGRAFALARSLRRRPCWLPTPGTYVWIRTHRNLVPNSWHKFVCRFVRPCFHQIVQRARKRK